MSSHHASLSLRVSDLERSRAEALLQDAYCEGRLDEVELDRRLGQVMTARTRRDLNASVAGLPARLTPPSAVTAENHHASALGGIAHLSGLVSWIFGPLLVFAAASPGSPARRHAAQAFNFQLVAGLLCVIVGVVAGTLLPEVLSGVLMVTGWLGWLTLTVIGGARAFAGQPWTNPVTKVLRIEPLDSSGR